jgi:hypothetical protein
VDRAARTLAAQIRAGNSTELVEIIDPQHRTAEAALATASLSVGGGHGNTIARGEACHAATMGMRSWGGLSIHFSRPRRAARRRERGSTRKWESKSTESPTSSST